jgi:hypothetical protein
LRSQKDERKLELSSASLRNCNDGMLGLKDWWNGKKVFFVLIFSPMTNDRSNKLFLLTY